MTINIYSIVKPSRDAYDTIINDLIKSSMKFATVRNHAIFNKNIAKAQTIDKLKAQQSYARAFDPYMNGYNIALDVLGKPVDSFAFAKYFENNATINFFIGGAYGFEKEFLKSCDTVISLSNLTYAHKIATLTLSEQIFRALCINNNHPYHK
ncbi:MAG: 23S rRNA (pseudouridine(1915)-N(3))-methyltransferase RlmH [Campylobacterota bacterium]|nr:23S rRNA (pseudouridine(1915)-N(3))-methyltransferase RlmH [Campylobacterota bacterium]